MHDASSWFPRPFQRLQELCRLSADVPEGNSLRVIDEWIWADSGAPAREWARFDSMVNLVLAEAPLRFVCLFDERLLSRSVLDMAAHTHPELIRDGAAVASAEFVAAGDYAPGAGAGSRRARP